MNITTTLQYSLKHLFGDACRVMSFSLALVGCLVFINVGSAQNNSLSGKVVFPAIEKKIKIRRGANYRNRLSSSAPKAKKAESARSKAANTVISLHPLDFKSSVEPIQAKMIQKDKTFVPGVLAVSVGSEVSFINEDKFYHNVFSLSKGARFNVGRKKPGVPVEKTFKKSGVVEVFCDIHPHMNAKIICLDTPFFASVSDDGTYIIAQLPDGKYRLDFYNPDVSVESIEIEFQGGQLLQKDFILDSENTDTGSIMVPERWLVDACCTGTICSNK